MFLFKSKKEKINNGCCCDGVCDEQGMEAAKSAHCEGAYVKILGSGCSKCSDLESNARKALEELGMDTTIDHITDFTQITSYGVMTTPALVFGGKVVSYGKVLKTEEIVKLLKQQN